MRVSILFLIFNLLSTFYLIAQNNLVLNPSFEDYDTCPYTHGGISLLNCTYWNSPSNASSDYFNICGYCIDCLPEEKYILTVPTVFGDFKIAKSGFAFSGFFNHDFYILPSYREYVQGSLKDTLINGNIYIVSFYLSKSKYSADYCTDNLGIYFSNTLVDQNITYRIPVIPQFKNPTGNYINNTEGWMKIEGKFTASGGEKYFSIGNFDTDANIHKQDCYGTGIPASGGGVYMFIDDVSVIDTSLVDTIQLCVNDSVLLGGSYRHTEGLYIDTIQGLYVRSYLKPSTNPAYHIDVDLPYNGRDSVYVGYFWFNKSNMHTPDTTIILNLPSVTGCDSIVYFHCRNNVGIKNIPTASIEIYPNPVSDYLIVDYDKNKNVVYSIHEISGKLLQQNKLIDKRIDVSNLSEGMYILELKDENNNYYRKKIIKNATSN